MTDRLIIFYRTSDDGWRVREIWSLRHKQMVRLDVRNEYGRWVDPFLLMPAIPLPRRSFSE